MKPKQHQQFLQSLRSDLAADLPGISAQYRMAPRPRSSTDAQQEPGEETRQGGVLILLYPRDGEVWLPLILRPTYSGVHSGQVGLPGGGYEPEDGTLAATALRETYEEIGVGQNRVMLLGSLTPLYIYASDYLVHPFVGWTDSQPDFHPDPYEVAKLINTPLCMFLDTDHRTEEMWRLRGQNVLVPFFDIQSQVIWGATAMIMSELIALPSIAAMASS